MSATTDHVTGTALLALAGLHIAWGLGSAFPFTSRQDLADAVVGTAEVPSPASCFAVASALVAGAALVADRPPTPAPARRAGLVVMAIAFGTRAALGWAGRSDLVSPGSNSARFRHLDRTLYSPLCATLAAGSVAARARAGTG